MEGIPEAKDSAASRNADRDGFKLGNAAILDLASGEDVVFADPKRPTTTFDVFFQAILRQIGMALEIPYEVLLKHFTASYSASRAAVNEAWRMFLTRRQWFAFRFCQPIYEAFVEEAVLKGRLNLPGFAAGDALIRQAWLGARWTGPGRGQIDELKEAQAADFKIKAGLSTMSIEIPGLIGEDWESVIVQRAREQAFIAEQGVDTRTPEEKAKEDAAKNEEENGDSDEETGDGDEEGPKQLPGKPPVRKVPAER